ILQDLGHGGLAALVDDVHDLPLAAAEVGGGLFRHRRSPAPNPTIRLEHGMLENQQGARILAGEKEQSLGKRVWFSPPPSRTRRGGPRRCTAWPGRAGGGGVGGGTTPAGSSSVARGG